jgi:hypothetical protein
VIVDPDGPGVRRRHTFAKLSGRGCLPICLPIYGAGLVNTGQHSLDERLTFALLRQHGTRLGNTGRTLPITLSRWRHGFESRWGCTWITMSGRSPERPVGFFAPSAECRSRRSGVRSLSSCRRAPGHDAAMNPRMPPPASSPSPSDVVGAVPPPASGYARRHGTAGLECSGARAALAG